MVIGVDVGYYATKVFTEKGKDIFLSTIKEGDEVYSSDINVELEGKSYVVGAKNGMFTVDYNKIDNEIFKVCLYTAVARNLDGYKKIKLATGLPIQYYSAQKEELIDSLKGKHVAMKLNGKDVGFVIDDVLVLPQGGSLALLEKSIANNPTIVIDIGGHTVDVSLFYASKLLFKATYEEGMLHLYGTISQRIKAKYGVSYELLDLYDVITSKQIMRDGEIIYIADDLKPILKKHTDKIITTIKNDFKEFDTYNRLFCGGGSMLLKEYLPKGKLLSDVHANAMAFYEIGVAKLED